MRRTALTNVEKSRVLVERLGLAPTSDEELRQDAVYLVVDGQRYGLTDVLHALAERVQPRHTADHASAGEEPR